MKNYDVNYIIHKSLGPSLGEVDYKSAVTIIQSMIGIGDLNFDIKFV